MPTMLKSIMKISLSETQSGVNGSFSKTKSGVNDAVFFNSSFLHTDDQQRSLGTKANPGLVKK